MPDNDQRQDALAHKYHLEVPTMKRPDDSTTYRAGAHPRPRPPLHAPRAWSLAPPASSHRPAYTLVEILTATVLMIIIMMAVTVIFASVTDSIGQSRATLEMSQRLRATAAILKQDLGNVTAVMNPPLHPRDSSGYFQYVEGPIGPVVDPSSVAWNTDANMSDTTVGDIDDIIMFTATTKGEPYIGLINGVPAKSNSAEIIWFIRGRTLYRRVLLVKPEIDVRAQEQAGFYARNDLSVRKAWDHESVPPDPPIGLPYGTGQHRPVMAANSLADLTRPECRFAHQPDMRAWGIDIAGNLTTPPNPTPVVSVNLNPKLQKNNAILRYRKEPKPFPHFLRPWLGAPYDTDLTNITDNFTWVPGLGLPTLAECSDPNWRAGNFAPTENFAGISVNDPAHVHMPVFSQTVVPKGKFDAWANEHPWSRVDSLTGVLLDYPNGTRIGEDVVLTNVIGFDVRAWDPRAPVLTTAVRDPLDPARPPDAPTLPLQPVTLLPGDPAYLQRFVDLQDTILDGTFGNYPVPPTGAYVDLNYLARIPLRSTDVYPDVPAPNDELLVPFFHRQGYPLFPDAQNRVLAANRSLAYGTRWELVNFRQPYCYFPAVYDTWSLHYEYNRQSIRYFSENPGDNNYADDTIGDEDGNSIFDQASNGLDDDAANGVDDVGERETQPPYRVPLQGIQVRIRVFEPGSRQVREVTLVQKFRTK